MRAIFLAVLALACLAVPAQAQPLATSATNEALNSDAGSLTSSGPLSIAVAAEHYAAAEASRAAARRRRGDPLWNGALIGGAIGAVFGLIGGTKCSNDFSCSGSTAGFVALGAATGAGIGIAVDAMLARQTGIGTTSDSRDARLRLGAVLSRSRSALVAHVRR